jgi:hypothetical protein
LKNFLSTSAGIKKIESNLSKDENYYNLAGQRINKPHQGMYIHQGKKVVK